MTLAFPGGLVKEILCFRSFLPYHSSPQGNPERHQKHHAPSLGMGREKIRHVVIKEGQTRGPEPLSVGRQVQLSTDYTGFQMGRSVPPIAVFLKYPLQGQSRRTHQRWRQRAGLAVVPGGPPTCL